MLKKVISGGQTGVDQGALRAARRVGLETGGWAPRNWMTERGSVPLMLQGFGLIECPEYHPAVYPPRTRLNVRDSDGTVFIHWGSEPSRGETLTRKACWDEAKPILLIGAAPDSPVTMPCGLLDFIARHEIETLNVAGNRESTSPGIGAWTDAFLSYQFTLENQ